MRPHLSVIGTCTATEASIFTCWPQQARDHEIYVHWRAAESAGVAPVILDHAEPYAIGTARVGGLPGSSLVRYVPSTEGSPPSESDWDKARRFRLLPTQRPLRVALVSCNGPQEMEYESDRYRVWDALFASIQSGNVDLVVHCGDQIYADSILKGTRAGARGTRVFGKGEKAVAPLTKKYRRWYIEKSWSPEEVKRVLGSVPNLMTWDDHDIFDGYGSRTSDLKPEAQLFFKAARQAYNEFQTSHGPPRLMPDEDCSLTAFIHERIGILLLDCRGKKSWKDHQILGADQLAAVRSWLSSNTGMLGQLYVVVGVPPLYFSDSAMTEGLDLTGLKDDMRDAWLAPNNRDECRRLLLMLFSSLQQNPDLEIAILSGDVHVAAIGQITSQVSSHSRMASIKQVIASGIGHPAPQRLVQSIIEYAFGRVKGEFMMGAPELRGQMLPLAGWPGYLLGARNFAIIRVDDGSTEGWHAHGNLIVEQHFETASGKMDRLVQVLLGSR